MLGGMCDNTNIVVRRLASAALAAAGLTGCQSHYEMEMTVPAEPPPAEVERMLEDVSAAEIDEAITTLVGFGTRHTLSETESSERGIGAARRYIEAKFRQHAAASPRSGELAPRVRMDVHRVAPDGRRIDEPVDVVNPMFILPGAMPEARDRLYYIIAHYDSRASDPTDRVSDAPGANDNASGTAVVMELARVMSKQEHDATLIFMPTAGEEQGLYGATLHAEDALGEGADIRAVLNNDTVGDPRAAFGGGMHDGRVRVFSEGVPRAEAFGEDDLRRLQRLSAENDSGSRGLARFIAATAAWHGTDVLPLLVYRSDRFLRGGDHTPFNEMGVPAVRFTVVDENYARQHQDVRIEEGTVYGDRLEYVEPEYVADVARVNLAAMAHLANAPSTPEDARLIVARLEQETTLRWEASPEPDVAGYEILYRPTAVPFWTGAIDVGDVTEATVEMNKDNFFFGVRAYDEEGYRSPAAFPRAARQ